MSTPPHTSDTQESASLQNKSAFPPPPELYKLYSSSREQVSKAEEYLWTPPEPIKDASFLKFGRPHSNENWVHDLGPGVEKLFQETSEGEIQHSVELRKLIHASGTEFLCLLRGLRTNSKECNVDETIKRISDIFANMAHLLNLLRPHQARQSLISIIQQQIAERAEETRQLKECIESTKRFLMEHGVHYDEQGVLINTHSNETEHIQMDIETPLPSPTPQETLKTQIAQLRLSHGRKPL